MTMQWIKEEAGGVVGAPGQLGMTADEWQFWNTSGHWGIYVLDATSSFPVAGTTTGNYVGQYLKEEFPVQSGLTYNTALRYLGLQRMRALYEQWSKKTSKPIKVCAHEYVPKLSPFEPLGPPPPAGASHWYCYDPVSKNLVQLTNTNTQIKTTCPAGYAKVVHDDGSFGCIAPYVPGPADFSGQTKTFSTTTPRGYRQPVTTVVQPGAPIPRPPIYRIAGVPGTLGAPKPPTVDKGDDIVVDVQFTICDKNHNVVYRDPASGVWPLTVNDMFKRLFDLAAISFLPGQGQVCFRVWSVHGGIKWNDVVAGLYPLYGIQYAAFTAAFGDQPSTAKERILNSGCWDGANWVPQSCDIPVQQVTTTTSVKGTCPPGYTKVDHPDGSFGCVPYVQQAKFPSPPGYRQPVTTVAPVTPYVPPQRGYYRPPTMVGVPGTLGALSDSDNLQAKALLQFWVKNNASAAPQIAGLSYGSQATDHAPSWGNRDGQALSAFTAWWDVTKVQTLDPGTIDLSKGALPWVDLSPAHKVALDTWAVENGFLPDFLAPGVPSTPSNYAACAAACLSANAFDPVALAACVQGCGAPPVGESLPFPLPSIPGIPGIPNIAQSNAPAGWPANFPWPPAPPSWLPVPATPIWPPIGNWGSGSLQKPSWWDATGVPWPPPVPGKTPSFPGQWPAGYPFPIPPANFVQTNTPAPAGQAPCAKGTVWDASAGACQPLPTAPPPKSGSTSKPSSSTGTAVVFAVVGAVIVAAVLAASSSARVAPPGLDENPRRKKTKLDELKEELPPGYFVATYSPGDGVTRYRFFDKPGNSYFGPDNGIFTALGYKEAYTYARGLQRDV